MRRLLREAVGENLKKILEGFDVIVVAKKGLSLDSLDSVKSELQAVFRKSGLLRN